MIAMPDQTKTGSAPFSIRLTPEERQALENRAGRQALGAYIRARLFDDKGETGKHTRAARRPALKDDKTLARLLAELGRSHLASNLNQLARAANSGSLPVTSETEQALAEACADVREIRETLFVALGLHGDSVPGEPEP